MKNYSDEFPYHCNEYPSIWKDARGEKNIRHAVCGEPEPREINRRHAA